MAIQRNQKAVLLRRAAKSDPHHPACGWNMARVVLPLAAALALGLAGCASRGRPAVSVSLAGAQIPLELIESWLQSASRGTDLFSNAGRGPQAFDVQRVEPVYLSMHAFQNLRDGKCDLACTDRPITARELADFGLRPPTGRRVAFYGYALYVNTANPLEGVFTGHLRQVFQLKMKDWKELAGEALPDWTGPIHLYGPEKSTRGGLILSPLANIWFADATWTVCASDAEIAAKVAADPLALGFASIGYDAAGVRYLGLREARNGPAVLPSLDAIEAERYDLAKVIYLYYFTPPTPAVQAVLEYLYSEPGRQAIESTDLWPVAAERSGVGSQP